MGASDWLRLLDNPEALAPLFGTAPELSSFDLFSMHIDERGTSVTLGFELDALPDRALAEWTGKGLNTFEFSLTFNGVSGLHVDGWAGAPVDTVTLAADPAGGVRAEIRSSRDSARWQARSVEVLRTRAYLASRSQ